MQILRRFVGMALLQFILVFQLLMTFVPVRFIFEAFLLNFFLVGDLLMLHSFTFFCISF